MTEESESTTEPVDDPDGHGGGDDASQPEERSTEAVVDEGAGDRAPSDEGVGSAGEDATDDAGEDATDDVDGGATTGAVAPDEIDPSELTVPQRSLNPRIRIIWIARAILTALIGGGVAAIADVYWLEIGPIVPVGVGTVLLVLGVPHALLRYRVWNYEVREDALYLERGVLTRVRTVVPFVRIQHVDTSRGPIERATGLATSVVYTAGSRGADVAIPGLEEDRAEDLQHRLKRLAIASEGDTAV